MFVPYSIANPLTTIRIPRLLGRSGELLVRAGDSVEPSQVIAQAVEPPDFRIVEVARDLDLAAKSVASRLKVKRGDSVAEGDILAARGGLSGRVSRAPLSGTIVGVGRGRLLLEAEPRLVRLNALIPGYVIEARMDEGVVIEAVGAHIQALWGNGQEAYGILRMAVREPRHPIRGGHINASAQGAILVGGSTLDEDSIRLAEEMQVRGIIVGSVPPPVMTALKDVNFPVVATEGVGSTPMSQAIFDLLRSLDGREAAVSGVVGGRWTPQRPYIVIPMPTQAARPVNPDQPLAVGQRVRVLRGEHRGESGVVSRIPNGLVQLETGARLPGALVALGDVDQLPVPFVNLERLL